MKQEEIKVRVDSVKKYPDVVFKCQELDNGSFVCIMQGGSQHNDQLENSEWDKFISRIVTKVTRGITYK